jgi:Zn finger protein HypA/HybF involved in hydrogenase expression
MSQAYFPSGPSLAPIERPRCLHCTSRMMLARISPGPLGFEHRLFECPKCGSVQQEIIASDPMDSKAAGWLTGELRSPT